MKVNSKKDTVAISDVGLRELLSSIVTITTPKGIDLLEISVKSTQFKEAQLIAISVANAYLEYNLDISLSLIHI